MSSAPPPSGHPKSSLPALTLGALGVVFGDIGTSPLYTLSQCVSGDHGAGTGREGVLGVLSLIFWALMMVVTVKYLLFIMRANNRGEGGILALLALLPQKAGEYRLTAVSVLVVIGAALLFGDGVITPAISVLSAVEGLEVATPAFKSYVVPITCVILLGLFAIQRHGTGGIGKLFGPVMIVWFLAIGGLGLWQILKSPGVLAALSPAYGASYLASHGRSGFLLLGSVVLAITGGEALYADMGHFGVAPIRISWMGMVMPALVLSYFGQGALVLSSAHPPDNPFFAQVPAGAATYALVVLSTFATIIASQALISGVFSLTHQAIALGLFPRVTVTHTSEHAEGQIYLPEMNWALAVACVALVVRFGAAEKLAAAYGIAVSGTMGITSIVYFLVARQTWKWSLAKALPLLLLFLAFDLAFFGANLAKFVDGGYVPISIAAVLGFLMLVWNRGRSLLSERVHAMTTTEDALKDRLRAMAKRLPGVAVFLTSPSDQVPYTLMRMADRMGGLAEKIVLLTVIAEHVPVVPRSGRIEVQRVDEALGVYRVMVHVGFVERANVPAALAYACESESLPIDPSDATYFLGRETLLATRAGKMGVLTESVFAFLLKNSRSASEGFALPPDQVVEVGAHIDL